MVVGWLVTVFVLLTVTTTVVAVSAAADPLVARRSPVATQVKKWPVAGGQISTPTLTTGSGWLERTDAISFLAHKNPNFARTSAEDPTRHVGGLRWTSVYSSLGTGGAIGGKH